MQTYPYRLVQRKDREEGDPACTEYKFLYSFKSSKTRHTYWVWIEKYPYDMYAVKFHLKAHRLSANRYKLMTGAHEARPVIFTCIRILLDIFERYERSSFGFVGDNRPGEGKRLTKRFRVYRRIVSSLFGAETFAHFVYERNSTYLLLRKSEMARDSSLKRNIESLFEANYSFFADPS